MASKSASWFTSEIQVACIAAAAAILCAAIAFWGSLLVEGRKLELAREQRYEHMLERLAGGASIGTDNQQKLTATLLDLWADLQDECSSKSAVNSELGETTLRTLRHALISYVAITHNQHPGWDLIATNTCGSAQALITQLLASLKVDVRGLERTTSTGNLPSPTSRPPAEPVQ